MFMTQAKSQSDSQSHLDYDSFECITMRSTNVFRNWRYFLMLQISMQVHLPHI